MNKVAINKYIMVKDFVYDSKVLDNFKNTFNSTIVNNLINNNKEIIIDKEVLNLDIDYNGEPRIKGLKSNLICMKPTFGRVSRHGVISDTSSLMQVSVSTNTIKENIELLSIISGKDDLDLMTFNKPKEFDKLLSENLNKTKIGIPSIYKDKLNTVINILENKGAIIEYIDFKYLKYANVLHKIIYYVETSSNLSRYDGIKYGHITNNKYDNLDDYYIKTRSEMFNLNDKENIIIGNYLLLENINYLKSLYLRNELTNEFNKIFNKYDYIISSIEDNNMLLVSNIIGYPSLTMNPNIQILSNRYKEDSIYKLANHINGGVNNE